VKIRTYRGLIIWTLLSRQLVVATTTKPNLGHLAPASEGRIHYHFKKGMVSPYVLFVQSLSPPKPAGLHPPIFLYYMRKSLGIKVF
jgi:hypothetical protein